jgi:hypothetical protein
VAWPAHVARGIAVGRIAAGAALLIAPRRGARAWVGEDGERPGAAVVTRSLGVRDLVMGAIPLHAVSHPQVGPRWVATCAVADLVDAAASLGARRALPGTGVQPIAAIAAASAAAGFAVAELLRRSAS